MHAPVTEKVLLIHAEDRIMDDCASSYGPNEDLKFDPLYVDVELSLAKFDEIDDPLGYTLPEEKFDWYKIRDNCSYLISKNFDLRVELWLLRAELNLRGGIVLFESIKKIEHYLLDLSITEVAEDKTLLLNGDGAAALSWISSVQCLSLIKKSQLIPGGGLSYDDIFSRGLSSDSTELSYSQIVSAVSQVNEVYHQAGLPALSEQLLLIHGSLKNIEFLVNKDNEGYQLDCRLLLEWIDVLRNKIAHITASSDDDAVLLESQSLPALTPDGFSSRQDVIIMLDKVIDYFERCEPGHPAPVLIRRSQKMIGMDFLAIVEDMLPDSLSTLQQFIGNK